MGAAAGASGEECKQQATGERHVDCIGSSGTQSILTSSTTSEVSAAAQLATIGGASLDDKSKTREGADC